MTTYADESDRDLLLLARDGDHEAFGEIALRYQASLRGYAARYIVSAEDVFDIVQDVFVDAFAALDRFDVDRPFGPWVRTICRNRVYRFMRDRKVHQSTCEQQLDSSLLNIGGATEDDNEEHLAALRRCVGDLPKRNRSLISLRYLRGLTIDEIASQVERTSPAVAMALSRLRGALRKCIEQRLENGDSRVGVEGGIA